MADAMLSGGGLHTLNVVDEFNRDALANWAEKYGDEPMFTEPGKPKRSAFIARFSKTTARRRLTLFVLQPR